MKKPRNHSAHSLGRLAVLEGKTNEQTLAIIQRAGFPVAQKYRPPNMQWHRPKLVAAGLLTSGGRRTAKGTAAMVELRSWKL